MIAIPLPRLRRLARRLMAAARARLARWTRPATLVQRGTDTSVVSQQGCLQ